MNKPENPLFDQIFKGVPLSELNALRGKMRLADEINQTLIDYKTSSGREIKYIWPKAGTAYAPFFERYYRALEKQTPWYPEPLHKLPMEYRLSKEEKAWVDLKTALDARINNEETTGPNNQKEQLPSQTLWDYMAEQVDIKNRADAEETPPAENDPSLLPTSVLSGPFEERLRSMFNPDDVTDPDLKELFENLRGLGAAHLKRIGELDDFLRNAGVPEEDLQRLREARERNDLLLREATARVFEGEDVILPADTLREPVQPTGPTIIDITPPSTRAREVSQQAVDDLVAQLPKTIKLTGGFDKINDVLAAQNGSEVFVSAKPEDLVAYVKALTIPLEKGATAKIDQLTFTLEPTPNGNNRLTLMGKVAVRKEIMFGRSVPAGSIQFKCALVNNLTLSGIWLESAPEYQLPAQFKGRKQDIEIALGNLDRFIFDGINRQVRYPWQATNLRIGASELTVAFAK